eukprot:Pgem_evm3s1987
MIMGFTQKFLILTVRVYVRMTYTLDIKVETGKETGRKISEHWIQVFEDDWSAIDYYSDSDDDDNDHNNNNDTINIIKDEFDPTKHRKIKLFVGTVVMKRRRLSGLLLKKTTYNITITDEISQLDSAVMFQI